MTAAASPGQVRAIHTLAKSLGLDDDLRRAVIAAEAGGKRSSTELTWTEAGRVIERLKSEQSKSAPKGLQTGADARLPRGALRLDGPFAGKLRALWVSAYNLGVVRDRTDKALCAFVERQTGLSHTRWLRESVQAAKAIEGLKKWVAREAGVRWPRPGAAIADVKMAVITAQCARLEALGQTPVARVVDRDFDDAAMTLGRQLRAALAKQTNKQEGQGDGGPEFY